MEFLTGKISTKKQQDEGTARALIKDGIMELEAESNLETLTLLYLKFWYIIYSPGFSYAGDFKKVCAPITSFGH